jgi:thimet oligopeptidase
VTLSPLTLPDTEHAEEWVRSRADDGLARARELADLLRTDPPGDALGALEIWDELSLELSNVSAVGSLFSNVHPLEAVRDIAERAEQDAMRLSTELSLDRAIYDVFAGLERADLDAESGRLLTPRRSASRSPSWCACGRCRDSCRRSPSWRSRCHR